MRLKKFLMSFIIFLFFIPFFYFGWQVFSRLFFNDFFVETPNFITMDYAEAEKQIKYTDLKIFKMGEDFSQYEKDKIYYQIPEPGKIIKPGRTIKVWISKGKKQIKVPSFRNLDLTAAKILAEKNNLKIGNISYAYHSLDYNKVISSDPAPGTIVADNAEISFLISIKKSSKEIYMPDLIGVNINDAKNIFSKNGLILGNIEYVSDRRLQNGIILDTNPKPGEKTQAGTVVNVILNKR